MLLSALRSALRIRCTLLFSVAVLSLPLHAQNSPPAGTHAAFIGVWQAQDAGRPVATLTLTNEDGPLSGAILFWLTRGQKGQTPTTTPGLPEPLLHLHFDGPVLVFQVSHRHAHPPASFHTPPVGFHMRLTRSGAAILSEDNGDSPPVTLTHTEP